MDRRTIKFVFLLLLSTVLFIKAEAQQVTGSAQVYSNSQVSLDDGPNEENPGGGFYDRLMSFPDKLFGSIQSRSDQYQQKLQQQTARYMNKLAKQEKRLQKKLAKKDTAAARSLFGNVDSTYQAQQLKLQNATPKPFKLGDAYSGHLDSLQTALKFMQQNKILGEGAGIQQQLQSNIAGYNIVQSKLTASANIQQYLKARQQLLGTQLEKYGLGKQLLPFKKQVYYYRAQMEEYKKTFENPGQLEAKLMEVLKGTSSFRDFFNKNAQLASIFRLPGSADNSSSMSLTGLQSRSQVQAALLQRFGSSADVNQTLQQQVSQGKGMLNSLKAKVNGLGGGSNELNMPDFKPNEQKTKPLLRRLEYGFNVQSQRSNGFFPNSSDLGLSVGYKLSSRSVLGIGASYKLGLGSGLNHISFTSEGIGLRSYVDIKIKGSIWASGGYEYNYLSGFNSIEALKDMNKWQPSGLIGLTKKYRIGKKQGNFQVLYDLLHARQKPQGQAFIFRIGYSF